MTYMEFENIYADYIAGERKDDLDIIRFALEVEEDRRYEAMTIAATLYMANEMYFDWNSDVDRLPEIAEAFEKQRKRSTANFLNEVHEIIKARERDRIKEIVDEENANYTEFTCAWAPEGTRCFEGFEGKTNEDGSETIGTYNSVFDFIRVKSRTAKNALFHECAHAWREKLYGETDTARKEAISILAEMWYINAFTTGEKKNNCVWYFGKTDAVNAFEVDEIATYIDEATNVVAHMLHQANIATVIRTQIAKNCAELFNLYSKTIAA